MDCTLQYTSRTIVLGDRFSPPGINKLAAVYMQYLDQFCVYNHNEEVRIPLICLSYSQPPLPAPLSISTQCLDQSYWDAPRFTLTPRHEPRAIFTSFALRLIAPLNVAATLPAIPRAGVLTGNSAPGGRSLRVQATCLLRLGRVG